MADFQAHLTGLPPESESFGQGVPFHIETYGCQMNSYDSQAIIGMLVGAGFQRVPDGDNARIILLNTCSVRDHAEHKILSRIGEIRLSRKRSGLDQPIIGVCGCMAERLGAELTTGGQRVDLVVGVDQYEKLPGLLWSLVGQHPEEGPAVATGHRDDTQLVAPPELYPVNNSHLVTIHKGCDYKCTYCIVPFTRGPQQEKPAELILQEIRDIVTVGGREVTLLGQNVTAYKGSGMDFAGLLAKVSRIDGIERIRFLTGHPCDMHPHLMDAIGTLDKVCPWLHVPAQSGSDAVLRRMKRYYTRREYLDMVDYARSVIPRVTFSSDFIVGFPGESDDDFCATLDLLREVRYDQIFSFKYSERPGAPAARLRDDVPLPAKKDRLARLMALQADVWADMAQACVGQVWLGIVEGPARKPAGAWQIRTANNRKVIVEGFGPEVGRPARVIVTGYANTTFFGTYLGHPAGDAREVK